MEKKLNAVITVRIFTDRKCFGPGIAELLHKVETHHSLRAAAKAMNMAYSKAWTITKNAEEGLGFKLLESSTGGKNGGGAALTEEAENILASYDRYCKKLKEYSDRLLSEEFG
ncbi:MAG: LysR family transcriptional regulator [Lachnospiraceae bacterium]|nr:LysR family transcriptional regulator [Lachnospiraceae bacterium]